MASATATNLTLEAGTYWIGDPCYAIQTKGEQDYWMDLLNACDFFSTPCKVELPNITVVAGGTAYGDGRYTGNNGFGYGVDAGLLGIIPLSTINFLNCNHMQLERLGTFHHFDEDFDVCMLDGWFNFGGIVIDTTDEYEDEQYGETNEYEDEYDDE